MTMNYRPLGGTGIEVSTHCLGTMMFGAIGNPDHDDCARILHAALDPDRRRGQPAAACCFLPDWIDLYQVHRPDFSTDIEETLGVLTDLVRQGKIRAFGCSTFPAELIAEAYHVARCPSSPSPSPSRIRRSRR
jgi:aryl-alcohol dehydrogenase-like predicted oxidoreductase